MSHTDAATIAHLTPVRRRNLEALIATCERYCQAFGFESHPLASNV
jgi:hypothetical protein